MHVTKSKPCQREQSWPCPKCCDCLGGSGQATPHLRWQLDSALTKHQALVTATALPASESGGSPEKYVLVCRHVHALRGSYTP